MKNKTLRNDLVVIVILFLIIGGLFFFKSRKQGQLIEITKDNQIYGYYSLNEDQIIKIDQKNTIQIKNQKVKMIQATCPDHLCIKQGTIDKKGSTIVCQKFRQRFLRKLPIQSCAKVKRYAVYIS